MAFAGITIDKLKAMADFTDMTDWDYPQLVAAIATHDAIRPHRPEPLCRIDPRDNERVLFSESRGNRPHSNPIEEPAPGPPDPARIARDLAACPVCTAAITPLIDLFPLPSGKATFFNTNLYPILCPTDGDAPAVTAGPPSPDAQPAKGVHLLQWLTNDHYDDLDTMEPDDLTAAFGRLAFLEAKLLHGKESGMPKVPASFGPPHNGYVGIIQNFGHPVGGSVAHGHLQIAHTNILPRRIEDDLRFEAEQGGSFAQYMVEENPAELTVHDFDGKVRMLIPYFMRRPLDAFFIPLETDESHLHHLSEEHHAALAKALAFATGALKRIMPESGLTTAYNLVFHTGPIGRMYVELLPYTQQFGGYEKMGLFVCHGSPASAAETYRGRLS